MSSIDTVISSLKFNTDGLIPAIAQDARSKDVLMLAWMNAESVRKTLESGDVWYYSRSRAGLWRKGESSGHMQTLVAFRYDCDSDALLLLVKQTGPACHTNRPNCFFHSVKDGMIHIISEPQE